MERVDMTTRGNIGLPLARTGSDIAQSCADRMTRTRTIDGHHSTPRLGVLATHPIQYQAPLFRELASRRRVQLDVAYLSSAGAETYRDEMFGLDISWDIDLLSGYSYRFLAASGDDRRMYPGLARRLVAWTLRQDVVAVHGHRHPWMLAETGIAVALRRPYLLRGTSRADSTATGLGRWMRDRIAGASVRHATAGLAIGELNAAFYEGFGAARTVFAPYSVDNERFTAAAAAARAGRASRLCELGLPVDRPVVVYSGKLYDHKRPLDAVAAIRKLAGKVSLIVIGAGPLRATVESSCADLPAVCVGFINQSEIPAYYALGDILVLPSSHETWGLVVNEAMACGLLPVVSDTVGCAPDLVRGIGHIFRMGDVDQLTGSLAAAADDLTDPTLPTRIAERIGVYSLTATAKGFEEAVMTAVQSTRHRRSHGLPTSRTNVRT